MASLRTALPANSAEHSRRPSGRPLTYRGSHRVRVARHRRRAVSVVAVAVCAGLPTGVALGVGRPEPARRHVTVAPHAARAASRPSLQARRTVVAVPASAPAPAPARRTVIGFRTRTEEVAVRTFSGRATWYGPGFHGRRTANGERFDQMAMTAAHRSLAFGTRLRVCTRRRCVIVRVNDRGPFGRGNVLDLSKGAARRLGTEHSGVAWITATALQVRTVKVPVYAPVPAAPPGPVRRLRAERVSRPEPPTGTVVREEAVTAAPDLELVGDEQRWSALASAGAGLGGLLLLAVMALPAWHFRRRKGLTFVRTR